MKNIIIFILISISAIAEARDNFNCTIIIDGKVLTYSTGSFIVLDTLENRIDTLDFYYYPGSIDMKKGIKEIKQNSSFILMNINLSIVNFDEKTFQVRLPIKLLDTDYCLVYIKTKKGKMIDFDYWGRKESIEIYKLTTGRDKERWIYNFK